MRTALLAGLMALISPLGGCAGPDAGSGGTALDDLCRAISEGTSLDDQRRAFFDRAHDEIHRLAEEVTERDPGIAARLLEAKEAVESKLEEADESLPDEVFERLIEAAGDALQEAEREALRC